MRQIIFVFVMLILAGCSYQGKNLGDYFEHPKYLIQDPHFSDYQEKRDAIESEFLGHKITYAEYVQKMGELDKNYTKEVQQRESRMASPE